MHKFVMTFIYTSGSWARILKTPEEDRREAVAELAAFLGGSLECIYWEVENASAHVIADLPDSVSAAAAVTAANRTHAFKDVQVREVLTYQQLVNMVALASSAEDVFRPPGHATMEREV